MMILLLLTGVAGTAQSRYVIDVVCIGAERWYRVDGEANSTYEWTLTDPLGTAITLPETADTVTIIWNYPTGVGIYTLATMQHDTITGCYSLIELGTIEVVDAPYAFAGDSVSLCLPKPYLLNASDAGFYSALKWTTSGDGTFDDDILLHPTYTFGANDILNGGVTLTLTAEGLGYSGSCPPAESSIVITLDNLLVEDTLTPASCPVVADGSVQFTVFGGTAPYTFFLDTETNQTGFFNNLAAGDHNYIIQDQDGCEAQGVITIGTLPPLDALIVVTDETYPGASDGTITIINPIGGSGNYEYSIDGGANWSVNNVFTGLMPGTYDVCIRDEKAPDCFVCIKQVIIGTDDPLTAEYVWTDVTCFGFNNGTITFSHPMNGSGTYEYSIDGGATWHADSVFLNLMAGDYTLVIRDAFNPNNYETLGMATILSPAPLTATVTFTPETLPGANDGTITITNPMGGTGLYEYSLDGINWQVANTFTGLAPGFYDVYIRDAAETDCYIVLTTIEIPAAGVLSALVDYTNVTCFGANDGTITIHNAVGGSGNYHFSIDGGLTWSPDSTYTNLAPGTYVVMMRDAGLPTNFVTLETVVISEPLELNADVAFTNDTCNMDGSITLSNVTGGSGSYEYSINGFIWQSDTTFTGLNAGFYWVYVRDSLQVDCYRAVAGITILNTCALTADVAFTEITCYNADDGTITITNPTGGGGDYSYSIDGGATWQSSGNFGPLAPGTYVVMMRDDDVPGSETTLQTITLDNPVQIMATVVIDNHETWPGANDGSITVINPVGGSGTYEYMLESGAVMIRPWQLSNTFNGLAPGTYDVWIRDANNIDCFTLLGTYEILPGGTITAVISSLNVDCFGGSTGSITVSNPVGGSGTFEYQLESGAVVVRPWQPSGQFDNLTVGTYDVYIRDAAIPQHTVMLGTVIITEPAALSAVVESTMIGCNSTEGTITFTNVTGGSGIYEYSIDGGTNWQSSNFFGNLVAGTYNPVLRDANATDCYIAFAPVVITYSEPITLTVRWGDATCGFPNGTIIVTATGGSGLFEYQLDSTAGTPWPWQGSNIFDSLWPGTYTLLVHDDAGCEVTYDQPIVIGDIPGVQITAVDVMHTTNSLPNGQIHIYANSVAMPIVYSIDSINWQASPIFNNLAAGTYTAWAKDANGCIDSWEFTVGNIVMGIIELVSDRVTECVGEIKPLEITVYEFDSISSFRIQLTYDPLVLKFIGFGDIHNNLVANLVTYTEITPGVLEISYTDPALASIPDGELMLELMMQGIAPGETQLKWQWLECIVLSPIGYTVPPTAVVNAIAQVFANPDLEAWEDGQWCSGDSTTLYANSSMEELVYTWTHPRGIQHDGPVWNLGILSVTDSGNYIVEARRDQCYTLDTVNIKVWPSPQVFISYSDTLCFGNPVVLDPGDTFVEYEWNTGSTMPTIIAYEAGIYWLRVVDINGCRAIDSVTLKPCIIEVLVPNAFTPNNDGLNDDFKPIFRGFEPANYRMDIYSKWGQHIFTTGNIGEGWDGSINGEYVSPDTFVYVISYEVPSYVLRMGLHSPITGRVSVIR